MTATTRPPGKRDRTRPPPLRLSWMETLGFSDDVSEWSEDARPELTRPPGRRRQVASGSVADWAPGEIRHELDRGNVRWSLIVTLAVAIGALAYLGLWLYQRPAAQTDAVIDDVGVRAEALAASLPVLEDFNDALLLPEPVPEPAQMFELETAARSLFQSSGELPPDQTVARSAASSAAEAVLDGIRLVRGAHAYRLAVTPILIAPELEIDPALIALDDAARAFGDWQLQFDQVRSALPEQVLPEVTQQMDLLSVELAGTLTAYVEALRSDDMAAAGTVLDGLDISLDELNDFLVIELDAVQSIVDQRSTEARNALTALTG